MFEARIRSFSAFWWFEAEPFQPKEGFSLKVALRPAFGPRRMIPSASSLAIALLTSERCMEMVSAISD